MSNGVIRPNTCSTCALKVRVRDNIFCRANPPSPYPVMGIGKNGPVLEGTLALFPRVDADMWCGQYKKVSALVADAAEINGAAVIGTEH